MTIGEKLKATREDLDLFQEDVANKIGVTTRQIIRWEKNETEMGINKLKELCTLYGVSADYILGLPKNLNWPR